MKRFYSKLLLCVALCVFIGIEIKADELKVEEIIAKHLDSMGTREKRAAVKNRMALGTGQFSVLRSFINTRGKRPPGRAVFLSEANKIFIGAKYDVIEEIETTSSSGLLNSRNILTIKRSMPQRLKRNRIKKQISAFAVYFCERQLSNS